LYSFVARTVLRYNSARFAKEDKGLAVEETQREAGKNRCESGEAFETCDIPDGRGGGAKGFILWRSKKNQFVIPSAAEESIRIAQRSGAS